MAGKDQAAFQPHSFSFVPQLQSLRAVPHQDESEPSGHVSRSVDEEIQAFPASQHADVPHNNILF